MSLHHHPRSRRAAGAALLAIALLGSACSSDDAEETTASTEEEAPEETTSTTEAEEEESEPAASGDTPEWAKPYETPGELLTTIEGENFEVAVYQVGVTQATKSGGFVDPDTNQPLIAEGDDIVFVNYVITNTSDEAIKLPFNLVSIDATYADWPYMQGMDSISDLTLYEEMKVNNSAFERGSTEAPFIWEPGTSFSYGDNFKYQAGSPITFEATLTPADDAGELLHDQRKEVAAEATIS